MNTLTSKTFIISSVCVMLLTGMVWYYYQSTEPFTERIEIGFSGMARRNKFLAIDRMLKEMGDASESVPKLDYQDYLYGPDAILMSLETFPAVEGKQDIIRQWLSNGGILMVGPTSRYNEDDQIFIPESTRTFLGIRSAETSTHEKLDFKYDDLDIQFPIAFEPKMQGYSDTIVEQGVFIAGVKRVGSGRIIFFNSLNVFNNDYIDKAANATFFYDWIERMDIYSLKIVYSGYGMSMFRWLWENAFISLVLLTASVLAWILMVTRRFGPVLPPYTHGSRRIMEHIEATGAYYWAGNMQTSLLKNMRRGILERVKISYPSWLRTKSLNEELVRLTGLSAKEVKQGMDDTNAQINEEQFMSTVIILRKIKESL